MKLQDAIDHFEGSFTCEQGAPWRWADLAMTKPYQTLTYENDVPSISNAVDLEHRLVARLITNATKLKQDAGFRNDQKPKLFWRWKDKIRLDGNAGECAISTRFYIDGNPGYQRTNPQKPGGQTPGGQIKLLAAA